MTLFPGILAREVMTPRLRASVLTTASNTEDAKDVVLFIHGNVSSALFWQPTMLALPDGVNSYAVDLRGFGGSQNLPVDATRGVRDFSNDVISVIDVLSLPAVHLVGWSMGAGVAMQLLLDRPELVRSLTLVAPISPFGFGGTGRDGALLVHDAAGTGGGGGNPEFVARLAAKDTSDEPGSPRDVFRNVYVAPGFESDHEDVWVESMLTTVTGDQNYPGDASASERWPGFAPGTRGVLNTMAPTVFDTSAIVDLERKPPILWVHGTHDAIVSDASSFDLNQLGKLGVIPGWPDDGSANPQPMVSQTRAVLRQYREQGGAVSELLLNGCGHSPHLERPLEFRDALTAVVRHGQSSTTAS